MRAKVTLRHTAGLISFVGACFAITLFLWHQFGGAVPLSPKSYRMQVSFPNASLLVPEADVRISGVDIGKVKERHLDPRTRLTVATLEIAPQFAPRPVDTRAILRQKTLLGELYVELTPGSPGARRLPEGGALPPGQSTPTVRVDQFLATFDARTRRRLATWLTDQGAAYRDGAPALSAFLAQIAPSVTATDDLMRVLREQDASTATTIRSGGSALAALTERRGQLAKLIRAGDGAFAATAARDAQLAETIRHLPGFLDETRATSGRVAGSAERATPLIDQLRPAARALSPAMRDLQAVAPSLKALMTSVAPLAQASRRGVPALVRQLHISVPLLARAKPYLGGVIPIIQDAGRYRREIAGFVANVAAITQPTLPGAGGVGPLHYARASVPINLESLAAYPKRFGSSRANPYPLPGAALDLPRGLAQFGGLPCADRAVPTLSDAIAPELRRLFHDSFFTDDPTGPPCRPAPLLGPAVHGGARAFPVLAARP